MNTILCIPRLEEKISKDYIFSLFRRLNWGYIESIRESKLAKESGYKRVVIKLRFNRENINIMNSINEGETLKLVYSELWYMRICKFIPVKI